MSELGSEDGAPPPRVASAARPGAVRLTQLAGGQFVLSPSSQSQAVPPLTQITNVTSTNTLTSQSTVTRVVSTSSTSSITSGTQIGIRPSTTAVVHQTIVNALTKTRPQQMTSAGSTSVGVMRTLSGVFTTPSSPFQGNTPIGSPAKKRLKLSDGMEIPVGADETVGLRRRILEHKLLKLQSVRESYLEHVAELFFLQHGGDATNYSEWRKRPHSQAFTQFIQNHTLETPSTDDSLHDQIQLKLTANQTLLSPPSQLIHSSERLPQGAEIKITGVGVTPVAVSTTLPAAVAQLNQQGGTPLVPESSGHSTLTNRLVSSPTSPADKRASSSRIQSASALALTALSNKNKTVMAISVQNTNSSSQEQIVEKAKQEAYVMQRISELQREGLWAERRLPRVQEPPRSKVHWDYLLEEMVWLSADFAQERKWKKAAAKKCARMVQKYFQDKAAAALKAEKAQELHMRRICAFIAKEVRTFWANAQKLVEFKQQTRLEEKRKQALDQHLSFIVDQTEKYSQLLAEGMNKSGISGNADVSVPASVNSSRVATPTKLEKGSDDEFSPGNQSSSDDEETIAQAEAEAAKEPEGYLQEVAALQRESELDLDSFLKELPPNYLENRDKINLSESENSSEGESDINDEHCNEVKDDEFLMESDNEESDIEDTILEQEQVERNEDHKKEIDELKKLGEMSIEELKKMYSNLPPFGEESMDVDVDSITHDTEMNKEDSDSSNDDEHNSNVSNESVVNSEDETDDSELSSDVESQDEEIGLKLLLDETGALLENSDDTNKTANKDNLINDVAALAESIQPKGNTLSSTSVVTPIPFLLKHHLREYQHIGLDWLVTMFERKLNGILADEMGLGKTIQTIALLAHLACEKEDWGPHLIIVPTSVMLNWEMECKKWCPGFKILTYYGTQKERKLKRTGWTKPNAFHICITSYKLVIQDHQSFRRKKWKYLILDEAQNIKNFKSQRWQLLLNFQTQQRLLLTGTPLQNNLMELWSLMHFLMPHVFQSHREFKEWFSNPVTGMIEGNSEYNESIIKRLHKVLRPFLLRRLKSEVEKQMPKKYEHIVMCRLSKRQRYLYDDFMSRAKTKETLATGNLLSVINVLMQLRKVCNHPNLFEVRPTISPFQMEGIQYSTASLVYGLFEYGPMKHINLFTRHILLSKLETFLSAVDAHRIKQLGTPRKLIEEIDTSSDPPPPCPKTRIKLRVKLGEPKEQKLNAPALNSKQGTTGTVSKSVNSVMKPQAQITTPVLSQQGIKLRLSGPTPMQSYSLQLVQHGNSLKAISLGPSGTTQSKPTASGDATLMSNSTQSYAAQIVQTSSGKHILLASSSPSGQTQLQPISTTVMTSGGQRVAVLSKSPFLSSSGGNMVITPTTTRAVLLPSGGDHSLVPKISQPISNHTTTNQETVQNVEKPLNVTSSITISQPLSTSLVQQLTQNASTHSTASMSVRETVTEKEQSLQSEFYDPKLEQRKRYMRNTKLRILARFNEERCSAFPLYGEDLRVACDVFTPDAVLWEEHPAYRDTAPWTTRGYAHCREAARCAIRPHEAVWRQTKGLCEAIHSVSDYVNELKDILDRFVFFVPAVQAPTPKFHVSHPPPGKLWTEQVMMMKLQKELTKPCALLHTIVRNMVTQFPDPRLIQFDCGKLQTLDRLLRKLKTEGHRVLIFTQMTRMLDVLESFLNYHGHIYLRLDGTTRVDQRQVLMERFNGDKRIFAFILSTRSGGVGVNLTGADTVIFYDSDWNPTMDAQAQDRCHRIGQTRDVHIYRLVSEKTIEENILKKANQKRMLGDLAIEGGNFTTAYFKSSTIQDLFNIDANEDASTRMAEIVDRDRDREKKIIKQDDVRPHSPSGEDRTAVGALENALAACEDEQDVQAARTAKAEAVAELAEFDESIPLEEDRQPETTVGEEEPELSKAEQEVENLVKQLTPIEQYAMRFVEANEAAWSAQQLAAVEAEIEAQKREWEANRLVALQEEEEARKQRQKEDDEILTFSHEDATNQVWISNDGNEQMPMWCPPSPPQDDNDVYIDHSIGFLYERSIMSESQLPPVYVKKEPKRTRLDAGLIDSRRALKMHRKEETVYAPRSLFDRPSPALVKMRRDIKLQKYRGIIRPLIPIPGLKISSVPKPQPEPEGVLEWMIHEDMSLLQAVQKYQGLPLNLVVLCPGHTPNWDLVSDFVNNTSRIYRSPKQCKNRYELVIIPREEGKLLYESIPKKQKKTKGIYKTPQQTKSNRSLRTAQLYTQDNNTTFSNLFIQRFNEIKVISNKRTPTTKPLIGNPTLKNPKHVAILAQSGVSYDMPPNPIDVAIKRAERIAKEKLRNSTVATVTVSGNLPNVLPQTSKIVTQNVQSIVSQCTIVHATSQSPSSSHSPIQVSTATSPATVVQGQSSVASALRAQRINSTGVNLVQGPNVVSVSGLAHLQAQRLIVAGQAVSGVTTKGITAGAVTAGGKTISPAQLQMYRQQLIKQQQIRLQNTAFHPQQQQHQNVAVTGIVSAVSKAITTPGSPATASPQTQTVSIQQAQVTQAAQRAQILKQAIASGVGVGKQTITARAGSDTDVATLIKKQHQIQQQKAALAVAAAQQGGSQPTAVHAQIFAQTGLQVQQAGTSGVATLVKAVSAPVGTSAVTIPVSGVTLGPGGQVKASLPPGVKATTATQQQIRQLQIHPQLLAQRKLPTHTKVAQLAQVTNKALIVQTPKNLSTTMTVQQLQQVMRVQGAGAQIATATGHAGTQHVVLAKPSVARAGTSVLPAQHGLKQTIQVVTATSAAQALASGIRPQVSVQSTLAGALAGTIKVASSSQQQALLSQVSAALQGQPVSVSVRQSGSPVRIQAGGTPLVAVSVQSAQSSTQNQSNQQTINLQTSQSNDGQSTQQPQQQQVSYRVLKK